jgi:hypothetical protein
MGLKAGRPPTHGKKTPKDLLRRMIVIEAFHTARQAGIPYKNALQVAKNAVHDFNESLGLSSESSDEDRKHLIYISDGEIKTILRDAHDVKKKLRWHIDIILDPATGKRSYAMRIEKYQPYRTLRRRLTT